jgi:hypothetical protein
MKTRQNALPMPPPALMIGAALTAILITLQLLTMGYPPQPAGALVLAATVLACLATTLQEGRK